MYCSEIGGAIKAEETEETPIAIAYEDDTPEVDREGDMKSDEPEGESAYSITIEEDEETPAAEEPAQESSADEDTSIPIAEAFESGSIEITEDEEEAFDLQDFLRQYRCIGSSILASYDADLTCI